MARGTVTLFDEFLKDLGLEKHNLSSDTIKVALINSTTTPTAAQTTPTWSDFSANEVSGSGYTAGGETVGNIGWATADGVTSLTGDDVGWTINALGPTNCRWGIIVNTSAPSSELIGFVDLGDVVSLQADDITIEWTGGVVYKNTANPA